MSFLEADSRRVLDVRLSRRAGERRFPFASAILPPDPGRPVCPPTSTASVRSTAGVPASGRGPCSRTSLLVDEINRASPKTQSALLEAMQESQVTVDGETLRAGAAVPRHRDPEPRRVRGHLPAARGAARPLRREDVDRLPDPRRGGEDARGADRRGAARRARACRRASGADRRHRRRTRCLRRGERHPLCRRAPAPHARRIGTLRSARALARESPCSGSPRRARSSSAASSPFRTMCASSPYPVLSHRLLLAPEARSAGLRPDDVVREALEGTPVPV